MPEQKQKVTLLEALKRLFGSELDREIELPSEGNNEGTENPNNEDPNTETSSGADNGGNNPPVDNGQAQEPETKEDKEMPVTFNEGWFNRETMTFDLSKVSDEATKDALQSVADAMKANNENLAIERAINDQIAKAGINVSNETFKKVLNTENIKVGTDGKVIGITEAFEALRKSEPSFFKEPTKESNPLNEGFSPVERKGTLTEDEIINMAYGQE